MNTRIAQPATILISEVGGKRPSKQEKLEKADSAIIEIIKGAKLIKYPEGFEETENYVKKVNKAEATYRELYFDTEEQ